MDKEDISFQPVGSKDSLLVFGYLKEAAIWLNKKGINYWQDWLDPDERFQEWILGGIRKKEFHTIVHEGTVIGIFRLQHEDKLFWGTQKDKAAYIHSFTISRDRAGQGCGYAVLDKLQEDLRTKGYTCLRLDCGTQVKRLRDYYENYGFKAVGGTKVLGEELTLYQLMI